MFSNVFLVLDPSQGGYLVAMPRKQDWLQKSISFIAVEQEGWGGAKDAIEGRLESTEPTGIDPRTLIYIGSEVVYPHQLYLRVANVQEVKW